MRDRGGRKNMELTLRQQEGLRIAVERYRSRCPYTVISGYAGSGKTTLVKFIIAALDLNPEEDVAYVAYTGKAATVLAKKGNPNATTAHKLLYKAYQKSDGSFGFKVKPWGSLPYKVIVLDECSMLPKGMWERLLSHRIYVIACGDPGQLPPINPEDDNHALDHPHIFLDEIMRQAQDSEIIRLSMWIREGKQIKDFKCSNEQVKILAPKEVVTGVYTWGDQILCATNRTRNKINGIMRQQLGFGPEPQIGDKVVSLSNHWEDISVKGNNVLTNGSIGILKELKLKNVKLPKHITTEPIKYLNSVVGLEDEDDEFHVSIDYKYLMTGEAALNPKQCAQIKRSKQTFVDPPYDFAYAYAMTYWKAQGSEWNKVVVVEEKFPYNVIEHQRAMYTACTRATKKLVLILN